MLLIVGVGHLVDEASLQVHAYPFSRIGLMASASCGHSCDFLSSKRDRGLVSPLGAITHVLHLLLEATDSHAIVRVALLHSELLDYLVEVHLYTHIKNEHKVLNFSSERYMRIYAYC